MNTDNIALAEKHVAAANKKNILFICTGNTCRSPMCAALYNAKYAGISEYALSAGLCADGSSISDKAVSALEDAGIIPSDDNNYKNHVSHTVTENDMEHADKIICVSASHMMSMIFRFPSHASKITVLPKEIKDPFGGTLSDYKACLYDIDSALSILKNGENL